MICFYSETKTIKTSSTSDEQSKEELSDLEIATKHKIVDFVCVVGFHHHIGGQVMQ